MRKVALVLGFLLAPVFLAAQAAPASGWQTKVDQDLPLLGHRNWILIVDSAYPLQSSPGVDTVETNADQLDVVRFVIAAINKSIHVRPDIFMDAELPYVQEEDAPGTTAYRDAIAKLLDGENIQSELHERLINEVDEASRLVHVLVLKTRLAVPYSSVFIRLNCKYWGDDAEERLRSKMGTPPPAPGEAPVPQPLPVQPAAPPPTSPEQQAPPAGTEPANPPQ
ncbi:MAG TPA: hypothetical protein VGL00_17620 [Terracidiphilus sp.]|jgi:hypothetical protein